MTLKLKPTIMLCGLLVVSVTSGCYAEAGGIPPPEYADGYAPVYYNGYLVDYDGEGRPFYYVNGAVVWVPATAPIYAGLVAHYHASGPAYRNWSAHSGERYHGYHFHGHRR
jgi:hypothetical protein